jgi:SAM-dependent methyltransferase
MPRPPVPPVELANRVGRLVGADGSFDTYEKVGKGLRDTVISALPADWSWSGKRVLDFGCGHGRTLRHFLTAAEEAEFIGCDIDGPSIAWLNEHLNPPVKGFVNQEHPPLPLADQSFNLIYAFSVFTHISDQWSAWLLELHRLLAPGGILIASFLGEGMSEAIAGEPWVEERVGMNVLRADQGWDEGGPMVLMSPWWIREHWGRAFDIVDLRSIAVPGTHGLIVATPRPHRPSREELERVDPGEPREIKALQHNLRQIQREAAALRAGFESSYSWRLTAPLRRLRRGRRIATR